MSVLGFRKLKTDVVSFGITVNVSTPSTYTSAYEINHFMVEPFVWKDFKIYGLSPVFTRQDGELTIISDCEAEGVRGLAPLNINKLIEDSPIFNITSYSNDDVSDWLEINTISVNTVTLKAGTYRFNDELNFDTIPFEYYADVDIYLYQQDANYQAIDNTKFQIFSFGKYPTENGHVTFFSYQLSIDLGATTNDIFDVYSSDEALEYSKGWLGEYYEVPNESLQTHTLTQDTEVTDKFGEWYIASTDYNEVNGITTKPIAEITYNGQTIAQLNAGETCTLKCAGLPMETDIIVKVNG